MHYIEQLTALSETVAHVLLLGLWGGAFLISMALVYLVMHVFEDRND